MSALAIQQVGGLCPAGTAADIFSRLKNDQTLDQAEFAGQCEPAALKELAARLPGFPLRRVPRLAKIALRAALEAPDSPPPAKCALIISASHGSSAGTFEFLDSILQDGAALASPTAFSHSVTNMTAAFLSHALSITGPCLTITQPSLGPALEAAAALLTTGQVEGVLWGIVDEGSQVMEEVRSRAGLEPWRLNDGAVFFRLSRPEAGRPLIEIGGPSDPAEEPELRPDLPRLLGSGPLAMALRLALTSLFLSEEGSGRTAALREGREVFYLRGGGSGA